MNTPHMTFKKSGVRHEPILVLPVNDSYLLGIYQGSISEFDILIKYRQKENGGWSRIRTPKHIHWAVDVLIKMHADKKTTEEFLSFLIKLWEETLGIKSSKERQQLLTIENLSKKYRRGFSKYSSLSSKGEYSITFLILLAKLLMIQEKTNLETAYMFKNLLEALKDGKDIFKIISIATHR